MRFPNILRIEMRERWGVGETWFIYFVMRKRISD